MYANSPLNWESTVMENQMKWPLHFWRWKIVALQQYTTHGRSARIIFTHSNYVDYVLCLFHSCCQNLILLKPSRLELHRGFILTLGEVFTCMVPPPPPHPPSVCFSHLLFTIKLQNLYFVHYLRRCTPSWTEDWVSFYFQITQCWYLLRDLVTANRSCAQPRQTHHCHS